MSSDPELIAVLERLDSHMKGAGSFFKKSSGGGNDVSSVSASAKKLDEAIRKTTNAVQALAGGHESALRHILRSVEGIGAIGGAISLLVNGVFEISKTYSKLTDIGQMFGGSMFEMASRAGAAGLSLGDFSKAMMKHSQSAAFITNSQTGATNAFMDVQKKVRDGLEKVGFYGMSLSELTDATFDYVDIMKTSGRITKMSSGDLANGAQRFLAQVSGISAASGISREEIIKSTKQAAEEPDINTVLA